MHELDTYCGFQYYGIINFENDLTEMVQLCCLYRRSGVDKQRSHLSSSIVSGLMTKNDVPGLLKATSSFGR